MGNHTVKSEKSIGTMDIILIVVAILLILFTIAMLRLFKLYGCVPDTLVTCVFSALGGECGIMGIIKTAKIKHESNDY